MASSNGAGLISLRVSQLLPNMSFKILHQFTVDIDKEVSETISREENGKTITETTKSVKPTPQLIILKEPSRPEKNELALFQQVSYNKAITMGLLPQVVMQQKIGQEQVAPLSEEEDKAAAQITNRLTELANEFIELNAQTEGETTEQAEKRRALLNEYVLLQKRAVDVNIAYQSVYAHTAENYKHTKTLTWLIFHLTYVKVGDKYESMFPGADFAAREAKSFELEDSADPLFAKSLDRLSQYWMLYLFGQAAKSEDFVKYDEVQAKRKAAEQKIREEAEKVKAATETETKIEPKPEVKTEEALTP